MLGVLYNVGPYIQLPYRSVITNFFWVRLDDLESKDRWFQQDSATCHEVDVIQKILHERFEDTVISIGCDVTFFEGISRSLV